MEQAENAFIAYSTADRMIKGSAFAALGELAGVLGGTPLDGFQATVGGPMAGGAGYSEPFKTDYGWPSEVGPINDKPTRL